MKFVGDQKLLINLDYVETIESRHSTEICLYLNSGKIITLPFSDEGLCARTLEDFHKLCNVKEDVCL